MFGSMQPEIGHRAELGAEPEVRLRPEKVERAEIGQRDAVGHGVRVMQRQLPQPEATRQLVAQVAERLGGEVGVEVVQLQLQLDFGA